MKKITPERFFILLLCFFAFNVIHSQSYTIYYENFDADGGNWASSTPLLPLGSTGSWVTSSTTIAGEGGYWRTNPFDNYSNNSRTYLTSPVISTAGFTNVTFYIDIRYKTEVGNDGLTIEYTTDVLGLTGWTTLGANGQGSNWFNDTDVDGIANNADGWSGQNEENAASPSKFIEASITATSVPILNNRPLRFRAYFASNGITVDDGVAIDNVILKGDYITNPANPTDAPANVASNLKLWLKATTGTNSTNDGTAVTQWSDQAFDNHAEGYGTFSPTFRNNATRNINYNPVIDFNRSAKNHLKGKGGYWSQDYFIVVKTNSTIDKTTNNSQMLISGKMNKDNFGQDGTGLGFGRISSRFNSNNLLSHIIGSYNQTNSTQQLPNSYGRSYAPTGTNEMGGDVMILNVKSNTSVTPNVTEIYLNGKKIDNHTGTNGMTGTGMALAFSDFNNSIYQMGIGRFSLNGYLVNGVPFNTYLDGRITEVFSYSNPKSAVEQQKIQSYLAIKNGVTLHAPNSTTANNLCDVNYLSPDGSIIWNVADSAPFNYDIAGIAREDASELNQKQSKSENPNTVLTIGLVDVTATNTANTNNFATNSSYVLWGSNGETMETSGATINVTIGPDVVTTITDVSKRKWKLKQTNGGVLDIRVSVPNNAFTSLPILTGNDAYVMVVSTSPTFTDNIETVFLKDDGTNQYCNYDFFGTKYITFGVAHETIRPRHASFDGIDDYIRVSNNANNNLSGTFSMMAWIRPIANTGGDKTIISKYDGNNGYRLVLTNDNKIRFNFTTLVLPFNITSTAVIPNGKWHNVAIINDGASVRLYIDGVQNGSAISLIPAVTTSSFAIGAEYRAANNIQNFFNGDIDEVRIWNIPISVEALRFTMNQEIHQDGTGTRGSVIPTTVTKNDISNLTWASLTAYYSMNSYIGTHLNDDSQFDNRGSLIIQNNYQIRNQTAPLPYESFHDGLWSANDTWVNGVAMDVPWSLSLVDNVTPINWNIVRTTHNVTSTGNATLLGLFVNSNTLTASNDSKIEVSHFLRLHGKIDLVGKSQLVQTLNSDLDVASSGSIERDQQGTKIIYNYNYWSSPVGAINTTQNNAPYTIASVFKDGTDPNTIKNINWIGDYDGVTTPTSVSLARYWLFRFQNVSNDYANWTQIDENTPMLPSQGFTLKGSGASSTNQNYTFVGKPNNGLITNPIAGNNLNLTGNPYPSALDATAFINANAAAIKSGALYFWEHSSLNNSHNTAQYLGGYSTRNNSGSVAPIANPMNAGLGGITKRPGRYIPVGQAFFVEASAAGGNLTFNNNQRIFKKENDAESNTLFRVASPSITAAPGFGHFTNNENDITEEDTFARIRLGYNNQENYHREILLAFMEENATEAIDYGYDAEDFDGFTNDMSFYTETKNLVIQGVGNFNSEAIYPLIVKSDAVGNVKFTLDEIENFDATQLIYIYDAETNLYHDIRSNDFSLEIMPGTFTERFSLRFNDGTSSPLGIDEMAFSDAIQVVFTRKNNTINIQNNRLDVVVNSVSVFNMLGQQISEFVIENQSQQNIQIPVGNLATGTYILKANLNNGNISKKFVVQ